MGICSGRARRLALIAGALAISLPIGLLVVGSVLSDAGMLVQYGGWWSLLLYLVTHRGIR